MDYVINTKQGKREVQVVSDAVPGLIVHRIAVTGGDGPTWTITHVHSGLAVVQDVELDEALRLLDLLRPITDWTRSITPTKALYSRVRRALRTVVPERRFLSGR